MAHTKTLKLYLEWHLRQRLEAGRHNFLQKVITVAEAAGFEVEARPNSLEERMDATARPGFGLTHMKPPPNARCLVFRRVYHYPFWQIDASDQRWNWQTAKARFDPGAVDRSEAQRFFNYWKLRLFAPLLPDTSDEGFIYIPLQGRLLEHRSFQSMSPLHMIATTRAHMPGRQIIATLHPNEDYGQAELKALHAMADDDPRLEIRTGDRDTLLPRCHAIVTQNSSVAFDGYFLAKPVILFAGIDFHHIALPGTAAGFQSLNSHTADHAGYIWWFWQVMSINAGHASAEARIAQRFRDAGWPMA